MSSNTIYTDGACSGNPGPGGWACALLLEEQKLCIELNGHAEKSTNNRMEMTAVLEALLFCHKNGIQKPVHLYTDSQYVQKGFNEWMQGWVRKNWINSQKQEVANKELWQKLHQLKTEIQFPLKILHVKGHSGHVYNERVDDLAVEASQNQKSQLFKGSPAEYKKMLGQEQSSSQNLSYPYYASFIEGTDKEVQKHKEWQSCETAVKGKGGAHFKKIKNSREEKEFFQKIQKLTFKSH